MITRDDVLIALSNSGESAELLAILPSIKRQGARLISMTGNAQSSLAIEADVHLDAAVAQEACPLNLAPTASTTAAGPWRRAGGSPARFARFWRGRFCPFAPWRLARSPPADACSRRDARRFGDSGSACRHQPARCHSRDVARRHRHDRRGQPRTSGDRRRHRRRPAARLRHDLDLRTLSVKRHHGPPATLDRSRPARCGSGRDDGAAQDQPVAGGRREPALSSARSTCTTSSRPRSSDADDSEHEDARAARAGSN
jgi:hypothetical protein